MQSNSDRALAHLAPGSGNRGQSVRDLPENERPLSEQFRIVALQYADAEAAASYMEEMKTTTLEKLKTALIQEKGDMPDNRAERIVKSSEAWEEYIKKMCEHRAKATKLKLQKEYIEMRRWEQSSAEANARVERRL